MILNSDISLLHPLWERADNELCDNSHLGIFNRLVDVYVLACAIGIKEDKIVTKFDDALSNAKSIGRNTHRENLDLRDMLDFMLQNALINSQTIKVDMDERLKLAFNPDYNIAKLSASNFLTGFANYGIEKIFENIDSSSSLVAVSELYTYFESLAESQYEEILKTITLDEIENI